MDSKYKYLPIEQAQPGDIVEWQHLSDNILTKKNKLYILNKDLQITNDKGSQNCYYSLNRNNWKLIKTKPGSEAKVGDRCIRISGGHYNESTPNGSIITVTRTHNYNIQWGESNLNDNSQFLVLCEESSEPELYSKEYYEYWEEQFQAGVEMLYWDKCHVEKVRNTLTQNISIQTSIHQYIGITTNLNGKCNLN